MLTVKRSHTKIGKSIANAEMLYNSEQEPENKQHECTVCQEKFVGENDLTKHYKDHMEKNLYLCVSENDQSEISINEQAVLLSWQQQMQSKIISRSERKNFECDVCHRKFSYKSSLIRHYSIHAEVNLVGCVTEEKKLVCCLCHKSFLVEEQLRRHYRCHVKPHECDVCHKKFPFKSNLITHYRTHLDMASRTCPVCLETFSNRRKLKFHAVAHKEFQPSHSLEKNFNEKNSYDDTDCDQYFQFETECINYKSLGHKSLPLETVMREISHKGELEINPISNGIDKYFQCDRCDKVFNSKSNLSIHYAVHTRIRRHKCVICFKSFTKTSHLQNHLRIHTGEKPYSCTMCDRSFSEKGNLIKHQSRHKKAALHTSIA